MKTYGEIKRAFETGSISEKDALIALQDHTVNAQLTIECWKRGRRGANLIAWPS